ncbi:MAG: hypothetical protein DDT20_00251 [Firmicutes bacterium]|nr:hypothetical protein [Bacillota bacterium]
MKIESSKPILPVETKQVTSPKHGAVASFYDLVRALLASSQKSEGLSEVLPPQGKGSASLQLPRETESSLLGLNKPAVEEEPSFTQLHSGESTAYSAPLVSPPLNFGPYIVSVLAHTVPSQLAASDAASPELSATAPAPNPTPATIPVNLTAQLADVTRPKTTHPLLPASAQDPSIAAVTTPLDSGIPAAHSACVAGVLLGAESVNGRSAQRMVQLHGGHSARVLSAEPAAETNLQRGDVAWAPLGTNISPRIPVSGTSLEALRMEIIAFVQNPSRPQVVLEIHPHEYGRVLVSGEFGPEGAVTVRLVVETTAVKEQVLLHLQRFPVPAEVEVMTFEEYREMGEQSGQRGREKSRRQTPARRDKPTAEFTV